ncbi:NAD(P)/FAD-dependent oxidoreductase [Cryobacterium sp. Y57]|uniref:dihydrolipoyl dehydrogenase family protein n=1 Tax=Cryobacterium sp. Y57 TaxID=2048287 RepID=UPI001E3619C5|nr:NAD(P)/FAD-dependent oxidoreductase [Cryobacterium sp. Y57]
MTAAPTPEHTMPFEQQDADVSGLVPDHFDVVVIGAGPAGTAAALRAAELGASVAVCESDRLGGTCVNTGCVPTRVLAKTARLMREIRTADAYGISVTERPIDWPATVARVQQTVDRVRVMKNEATRFADAGVELILEGRARFLDASTLSLESGRRVTAGAVLVCVGGHSRRLPVAGAELATVPEHVLDLPSVPARLAVIGGGNTGAQLVTTFRSFGSAVTLLDVASRVLATSDESVSQAVAQAFVEQGVSVRLGIDGIDGLQRARDGSITLTWRENGHESAGSFDVVIMATGWPADIGDLGLENAGVVTTSSSIPVDANFRSSVPHIFAVGDANGQDMLVQAAQFEGEAAAENAVLNANRRTPHHLLPSGGFTDPDYAGVGLTEVDARSRDELCVVTVVPYSVLDRAVIDDRQRGFLRLIADRRYEFILGAHAVGENAVEVIQSVTTAMAAGIDLATLANVRFAYPTYSAVIGLAARALLAEQADSAVTLDGQTSIA